MVLSSDGSLHIHKDNKPETLQSFDNILNFKGKRKLLMVELLLQMIYLRFQNNYSTNIEDPEIADRGTVLERKKALKFLSKILRHPKIYSNNTSANFRYLRQILMQ